MASATPHLLTIESCWENLAAGATRMLLRPVQVLIGAPVFLFLAALAAMLLRHPEVDVFEFDRLAFVLLVAGVVLRRLVLGRPLFLLERATWPMLGLTLLALSGVLGQSFDAETWSLLAAKFIVPFVLFHLATVVFTDERCLHNFEVFALAVLAYLSFTAIAFLIGAHSLIFPRYILDEGIGFHADRARGPFLQAVANGVSLNILGLIALHAYRRGTLRGAKAVLLLASVPIAILATLTRAVWLSFFGTVLALILFSKTGWMRRLAIIAAGITCLGALFVAVGNQIPDAFGSRLEDRGPIEFRQAVYAGGWDMFLQRPWFGWGFHEMPYELPRHVSGYPFNVLYPHNTYLELMAEEGIVGFATYVWLMWELLRLGRGAVPVSEKSGFLGRDFHRIWPIVLIVYSVNAGAVVMNYQFVNGLLFTMAGMLAAQRRRSGGQELC